jgi:hypothetical protein
MNDVLTYAEHVPDTPLIFKTPAKHDNGNVGPEALGHEYNWSPKYIIIINKLTNSMELSPS